MDVSYSVAEEGGLDGGSLIFFGLRGLLCERTCRAVLSAFSITNRLILTPDADAACSMFSFSSSLTQKAISLFRPFFLRRDRRRPVEFWLGCGLFVFVISGRKLYWERI